MSRSSRAVARTHFTDPVRIALLEEDLDQQDQINESLINELAGIRKVLTGLMCSVTGGIIVGVILFVLDRTP